MGPLYQLLLWVSNTTLSLCTEKNQYRKFKTNILRKEFHGHCPNFHIHVSVSDLYEYIPTIDLPILMQEILYVDRSWEYINRSQTHESGNWDWGRAIPRNGIHKGGFRCSVVRRLESCKSVLRHCVCEQLQDKESTQVPTQPTKATYAGDLWMKSKSIVQYLSLN